MDELTIRDCVSDEGNVGGIHLITTPEASNSIQLTCLSNTAAPGKPTHVLVEGLDKEQTHVLLAESKLLGTAPHFGWKTGDGSGTDFGRVDVSSITFTLSTTTAIQSPNLLLLQGMHPSELHLSEIFTNLPSTTTITVEISLPFDVPVVQKPITFVGHTFFLGTVVGEEYYPNVLIQQDPTTLAESLFTLQATSKVELRSIAIQLDSLTSSPLVKVDASSTFIVSEGVIFGSAGQFHRPFLKTSGEIDLHFCHFYGLSFNGHSCIEMSGGRFGFDGQPEPVQVSSVVNVSTTGNGAFLSSSNSEFIDIHHVFFVNCSAEAGGAVFVKNAEELDISSFFDTCIASTGGAVMIVDNTGSSRISLWSSFVNCQARRGGGVFLSLSEGSSMLIRAADEVFVFGRYYSHAVFENCFAEQGAGIYVEGTMKGDDFDFDIMSFNNWNAEGLGTDIFFAKSVHFDDLTSKIEYMREYVCSTSRQSTDLSKQCQVYFESSPSDSFDFRLPEFELNGSETKVASPLTDSGLNSFRAITPYLHVMDDRGKMLNMTVSVGTEFCIFERGFCTTQHISFIHDEKEPADSSVKIKRGEEELSCQPLLTNLSSHFVEIRSVKCGFQVPDHKWILQPPIF
ncbi:hypothetical protein BLNAU_14709 [Blattamonas nauphoetae]|uniref:Right handed beta helix domain-containing protein n=1 Tax=Blattamonas nauphoetae TaxID=2049346 RepID=A0ABQ9XFB2_9EUKA|nr:hypothetical protein BLNAU_14709 [Blattamonas nauphoetae]